MNNCLIFGCGYLGRRVAARLLATGRRVHALTRGRETELRAMGIEPVRGDVLDPGSLASLPSADTVIYAIGLDRSAGHSMRDVYVHGLGNVLSHLPMPSRFIYVSSTSVYCQAHGEEVNESAATEPNDESGRIVLEAEHLLRSRLPGAIILRLAGIYGPGRLLRRESAIRAGEPIVADLDGWLNLIHVDDAADALLAAEQHGSPGSTYNICDGSPVRRRDFYTRLAEVMGAPIPPLVQEPPQPHKSNRRIANQRMRTELLVVPRFVDYSAGLLDAVRRQ